MEPTKHKDQNETAIITSSEMNRRTFHEDEFWASLESTILGGNLSIRNETESSSSGITEESSRNKDKSKLTTVSEEQNCTNESNVREEFGKQEEETEECFEDDNNVLNMNIDAIDDEEVFFDCPTILSPRPYFLNASSRFAALSPRPYLPRTRSFISIRPTCNGISATGSTSGLDSSTVDSGLDEERTGLMIGQIVNDFNDMGEHAQSTPKLISECSELGSSISSANNLTNEDKNNNDFPATATDFVEFENAKKKLEFPMDENNHDTSKMRKKKIEVPADTYEFIRTLDLDDKQDEFDSNNNNNNIIIMSAKKRLERPSEIVRRLKILCLGGDKNGQKKSEPTVGVDGSEKSVDLSEGKRRDEEKIEDLLFERKAAEINAKTESNSVEAVNDIKKKFENLKSMKDKPRDKSNLSNERSIRPLKPINKFYKCPSPVDKTNKENYYAGKYSTVKKIKSPSLSSSTGLKRSTRSVAKMKEFFENRSRVDANSTSRKPLIGHKKSPKGPTFHTTVSLKLRKSPKSSQASQASIQNASSYNNMHDASTFLLARNQSRYLRPSSCSDYYSKTASCSDNLYDMSSAQKSKSMDDLSSESAQVAEVRQFAMSKHITKRAYLVGNQRTTLHKRTPKKQTSPGQLLTVHTPKKMKSDIMKRKSFGYVSSPVKPVTELRKMFSPSMMRGTNVNAVKKHTGRTSKTLPHIVVNGK